MCCGAGAGDSGPAVVGRHRGDVHRARRERQGEAERHRGGGRFPGLRALRHCRPHHHRQGQLLPLTVSPVVM